jgi:hypothetical protein
MDEALDRVKFPKGMVVKVDGIPFWLAEDTILIGDQNSVDVAKKAMNPLKSMDIKTARLFESMGGPSLVEWKEIKPAEQKDKE